MADEQKGLLQEAEDDAAGKKSMLQEAQDDYAARVGAVPSGQLAKANGAADEGTNKPEPTSYSDVIFRGKPATDLPLAKPGKADDILAPTERGLANIAGGVVSAGKGMYNTIAHPIDTARGIATTVKDVKEVPGAIRDISKAPDAGQKFAEVAENTAGQGAGQALVAAATPSIIKGVGKAIPPIIRTAGGVIERGSTPANIARVAGAAAGEHGGLGIGHLEGAGGAGYLAGKGAEILLGPEKANTPLIKVPGMRNFGAAQGSLKFGGKAPVITAPVETEAAPAAKANIAETPKPAAKPTGANISEQLNRSLGNEPVKPGVKLSEQSSAPAAEPEHLGQFARTNGTRIEAAIDKSTPDISKAIHGLSNSDLADIAQKAGVDLLKYDSEGKPMGMKVISRAKGGSPAEQISRAEVFNKILDKGLSPKQILDLKK